jgi:hypothetical protein
MNRELDGDDQEDSRSEYLNVLLVESIQGWGEVKSRVKLIRGVSIDTWIRLRPRWELVSLA